VSVLRPSNRKIKSENCNMDSFVQIIVLCCKRRTPPSEFKYLVSHHGHQKTAASRVRLSSQGWGGRISPFVVSEPIPALELEIFPLLEFFLFVSRGQPQDSCCL
jgi:hypothetical protein